MPPCRGPPSTGPKAFYAPRELDGRAVGRRCRESSDGALLLIFLFLLFFVVFLGKVPVFGDFGLFLFFFVILVLIIGDDVEVHGMGLGDLELRLAFGAAQNLAFFDFIFIDIDFRGAFRAADHGYVLRRDVRKSGVTKVATATTQRIIYRGG